jgi:hypothetical protein
MVSRVHRGRSEAARLIELDTRARQVDQNDPQAMAQMLQEAGDLVDAVAPVDQEAFREIVARRAEGASDDDLHDVVEEIPFQEQSFRGSIPSPYEGQPIPHAHHHCHDCEHEHGPIDTSKKAKTSKKKHNPRRARDLGWTR